MTRHGLLIALTAFTAVHGGLVAQDLFARPDAMSVTRFQAPFPTPEIVTMADSPVGGDGQCRILVAFVSGCPYCNQAAERFGTGTGELPVVWVGENQAEVTTFGTTHPDLTLVADAPALAELGVEAVPAAFLVDGDQVLDAWRFEGDEDLAEMAGRCTT